MKVNNNNDEELVLPKASTKNKDKDANKGDKNELNQENQQQQDYVENHVNPENEINTKIKDDNIIDNK